MADAVAGIAMPEGDPGAIADAAQSMGKLAHGFSYVAQHFRSAAGVTPSWQGPAASEARASLQACAQAADASREACVAAHVEVDRYAADFEAAYERVKRLQEEAREVKEQLRQARREAAAAGERAADARGRAAMAMMASPIDVGGGAQAAQREAEREAQAAEAEQARWEQRATRLQEELEELRERAADQRKAAREAEAQAAHAVTSAEGQFPAVPAGAGPGAGTVAAGGQPGWPFAGPLMTGGGFGAPSDPGQRSWQRATERAAAEERAERLQEEREGGMADRFGGEFAGLTGFHLFGDKDTEGYQQGKDLGGIASFFPTPGSLFTQGARQGSRQAAKEGGEQVVEEGAETAAQRNLDEFAPPRAVPGRTPNQYWTKSTDFEGHRVHQRDDLIDPMKAGPDGKTNLERMREGLAPIGPDGKRVNLHHTTQQNDGALAEVTQTMHTNHRETLHINPRTTPSGIDRQAFDALRKRYWEQRGQDFAPDAFSPDLRLDFLP